MLKQDLKKNICGIGNVELYKVLLTGTKECIEEYHQEVIKCIQFLYYYSGRQITPEIKLKFFDEASRSYGKTAMFFSGGAGLGRFHYGIIKALAEQDLMPKIIVGSSSGSLLAACLSTLKFDELSFAHDYESMISRQILGWHADTIWGDIK